MRQCFSLVLNSSWLFHRTRDEPWRKASCSSQICTQTHTCTTQIRSVVTRGLGVTAANASQVRGLDSTGCWRQKACGRFLYLPFNLPVILLKTTNKQTTATTKVRVMHAFNCSTKCRWQVAFWEFEASQPGLHSEFQASQRHLMKLCLKTTKANKTTKGLTVPGTHRFNALNWRFSSGLLFWRGVSLPHRC